MKTLSFLEEGRKKKVKVKFEEVEMVGKGNESVWMNELVDILPFISLYLGFS